MVCKEGTEKIAYNMGGNEAKTDFVLIGKSNKKYLKEVKAIPWQLQHGLVVTEIYIRKLKKVMKNKQTVRTRVWKLKETNIEARFQNRIEELVDVDVPNI